MIFNVQEQHCFFDVRPRYNFFQFSMFGSGSAFRTGRVKPRTKLTWAGLNLLPFWLIQHRTIFNFLIFHSLCSAFLWSFNSFLVPLNSHLSHGSWGLCSVLLCLLNTVILSVWNSHSSHWCVTWWTVFLCSFSAGFVPRKLHSVQGSRVTYLSCS